MNAENTKKLLEDFPHLYGQYHATPQHTCMCWGFEVGDGWFNLLYELSEKIVALDKEVQAVQVKQKFGSLRFYTTGTSNEVFELIDTYSELSAGTCEKCGTTSGVEATIGGFITPLCHNCKG